MTGKRRVFVIELRREGDGWRGRLRDNDADEQRGDTREHVVRDLQLLAFTQLEFGLRRPSAPLVKEVVFEVVEADEPR